MAVRNRLLVPIGVPAAELESPAAGRLGPSSTFRLLCQGVVARTARLPDRQKAISPSICIIERLGADSAAGAAAQPSISQPHTRWPLDGSGRQRQTRTGRPRRNMRASCPAGRLSLATATAAAGTARRRPAPKCPAPKYPAPKYLASLVNIAHLRFRISRRAGEREGKRSASCDRLPPRSRRCRDPWSCHVVPPARTAPDWCHRRGYCPFSRHQVRISQPDHDPGDSVQVVSAFTRVKDIMTHPPGRMIIPAGG